AWNALLASKSVHPFLRFGKVGPGIVKKLISARFRTKAKRSPVGGSGHIIAAHHHSADHIVFGSPKKNPGRSDVLQRVPSSSEVHSAGDVAGKTTLI